MIVFVVAFTVVLISLYLLWHRHHEELLNMSTLEGKPIFISGCDTGFGELTSIALYKRGFKVFSGCLTDKGIANLTNKVKEGGGRGSIVPIKCDITKEIDVENALKIVTEQCPDGLWGLINNAGVGLGAAVEWTPLSNYRKCMEVNFFGHVSVTKAFLPMIRKGRGRVINITSIAGVFSVPHLSPYSASKFALESFNDALRREMHPFGVSVVAIEPGFMKTQIIASGTTPTVEAWEQLSPSLKEVYTQEYIDTVCKMASSVFNKAENPALVVDCLVKAVSLKHPRPKYPIGNFIPFVAVMVGVLPVFVVDYLVVLHEKIVLWFVKRGGGGAK